MEDDLIVVDDEPTTVSHYVDPDSFYGRPPRAQSGLRSRRRSTPDPEYVGTSERTTRSALKPKGQPKLKLKISEKSTIASGTSFLGPYDRELDSDDEELAFEEQFILRMPPGEDCERLRKMVAAREASNDVWFKFKDSRRAVFHVGNNSYSSKLVDLPCIVESQKTLDNKQMFKVADICQMLVVEDPITSEDNVIKEKSFNVDEFIWPHGITPPLHHVRKRRFRKRVNRRTIETVEQEVERLLEADQLATTVAYDVLENVNPDLSDSEFIEMGLEPARAETPGATSDGGDGRTPGAPAGEGSVGSEDEQDGDIDEELAAELDLALGDEGDDEGDEDDDEDQSDDEDEDEDEDEETSQSKRLLNEEIRDLEAAVARKSHEIASSANPLIKRRFEDALKKLQADLEMKLAQRDELNEQQRMRKEGITPIRSASEANDDDEDDDADGGMDID